MQKTAIAIFGAVLISGIAIQTAAASDHGRKAHHKLAPMSEQFRNANGFTAAAKISCQGREPGNPYDRETDFQSWSAFRVLGAWDSRNDC